MHIYKSPFNKFEMSVMEFQEFISVCLSYPTAIFSIIFAILFIVMLADLIFGFVEGWLPELDFFELDDIPGSGLLLPPVLTKIPLMVALCSSFFISTIFSFYFSIWTTEYHSFGWWIVIDSLSIPLFFYIALHVTALIFKPLSPVFNKEKSFAKVNFIGLTAKIYSNQFTQNVGEIMVTHGGNEYLLDAMSDVDSPLNYGDLVVIVDKDKVTNRYIVTKLKIHISH